MEPTTFTMPGASKRYHTAREELLAAELELREHVERVAALRRTLPPGPSVPDYEFFEGSRAVRLSELFADGKPYLLMYHLMYDQDDKEFCPMCSMWVDGWNGVARHIAERANIVAAALAPADVVQAWAKHRDWQRIRVLADADAALARDTGAEDADGDPMPTVLVFEKTNDGIRHVYTGHAVTRPGSNRGIDQLCPTWHLLDLLPSGRGEWTAGNDYLR
jgi:predicted dithiol-disulfide oxidoreductase (DUF899 family)